MSTPRKTSKRALPDVPGAAMVQALGDAVFGVGKSAVEQTYPMTFAGRPVTVSLSVEEVVRYLTREGWKEVSDPVGREAVGRRLFRRGCSLVGVTDEGRASDHGASLTRTIDAIARVTNSHPLDVVDAILAARHGAAPPGDADPITAAILRLFRVAPDKGIAEDEVVRHLLASGLNVDSDDVGDCLVKMHVAGVLKEAWRGKADKRRKLTPHYARGPAFPVTGGAS